MELPRLTDDIKKRLIEIKFYLILEVMRSEIKYTKDITELIRSFCELFGVRFTHINYVIGMNEKLTHKPTKKEIIIASRYLGIPVRQLNKVLKTSNSTYYKLLDDYKKEGMPELMPKYSEEQYIEMVLFIKGFQDMFKDIEVVL